MTNEDIFILWLTDVDGVGVKKRHALLERFGSAEEVYHASSSLLRTVDGLSEQNIRRIRAARDINRVREYAHGLPERGIRFLSMQNPLYPSLLKTIYDPPTGLYVMGELPADDLYKISVVGTRRCTDYGATVARLLAKELAARGLVVVSGMARGIDSYAHRAAIDGGGMTMAVLGCGVDICYPPENRRLREDILRHGCLVSEYKPGTPSAPGHFPVRNRIISGLSPALLVVEAAERSGTLITIDQALDQGREVMAVPGNITSKTSKGTNALIRQGAALVTSCEDILLALGLEDITGNAAYNKQKNQNNIDDLLAPDQKLVYDIIDYNGVSMDEVLRATRCQPLAIHSILLGLELKGLIKKLPGLRYIRL